MTLIRLKLQWEQICNCNCVSSVWRNYLHTTLQNKHYLPQAPWCIHQMKDFVQMLHISLCLSMWALSIHLFHLAPSLPLHCVRQGSDLKLSWNTDKAYIASLSKNIHITLGTISLYLGGCQSPIGIKWSSHQETLRPNLLVVMVWQISDSIN